jgi:hypothetical protein
METHHGGLFSTTILQKEVEGFVFPCVKVVERDDDRTGDGAVAVAAGPNTRQWRAKRPRPVRRSRLPLCCLLGAAACAFSRETIQVKW